MYLPSPTVAEPMNDGWQVYCDSFFSTFVPDIEAMAHIREFWATH